MAEITGGSFFIARYVEDPGVKQMVAESLAQFDPEQERIHVAREDLCLRIIPAHEMTIAAAASPLETANMVRLANEVEERIKGSKLEEPVDARKLRVVSYGAQPNKGQHKQHGVRIGYGSAGQEWKVLTGLVGNLMDTPHDWSEFQQVIRLAIGGIGRHSEVRKQRRIQMAARLPEVIKLSGVKVVRNHPYLVDKIL